MIRPIRTSLLFLAAMSCRPAADGQPATDSPQALTPRADNDVDPATVSRGDTVGAFVLDSIERQRTPSGEWVGRAWFSGTVSLTGRTFRHPDGADYPYPCFEADTVSAIRLPHWSADSRRPWFCFENAADARRRLRDTAGEPASIVVDRFTIHRNLSDAVNSARLVDAESGVGGGLECFSTPQSILARQPGSVAPGPRGLTGTIRLSRAAGGASWLVDSDGRSLGAGWRTVAGDSIVIVGQDDFLRIELRVARTPRGLSGTAIAQSDAALERDSTGQFVPFRRQWRLDAPRIECQP